MFKYSLLEHWEHMYDTVKLLLIEVETYAEVSRRYNKQFDCEFDCEQNWKLHTKCHWQRVKDAKWTVRRKPVPVVTEHSNLPLSDFETKKSTGSRRVFFVTELVVSRTQSWTLDIEVSFCSSNSLLKYQAAPGTWVDLCLFRSSVDLLMAYCS